MLRSNFSADKLRLLSSYHHHRLLRQKAAVYAIKIAVKTYTQNTNTQLQ